LTDRWGSRRAGTVNVVNACTELLWQGVDCFIMKKEGRGTVACVACMKDGDVAASDAHS
jgi:hypothetical protein